MEVVSIGRCTCAANYGYRCAGAHLVTGLLHEFLVVLVDGDDVTVVLDADRVAFLIRPSCCDHSSVQHGHHNRVVRGGDVNVGMKALDVALGHNSLEGCEEMHAFDRKGLGPA